MKKIRDIFNKKGVSDQKERGRYGMTAGVIGIIINAVLFSVKLVAGILSHSVSITADAVNNLTDAGTSVVTLVGFKLASRPADKEHPYGHARYEYIAGLVCALTIFAIGVALGKTSIDKIIDPGEISVSAFTYAALGLSVLFKLALAVIYRIYGKILDSGALRAAAADSRNDIFATLAAFLAALIYDKTALNMDGLFGLLVSLFIALTAVKLIKSTISPLIGTLPDKELTKKIMEKILSYEGVLGLHDLMLHNYGVSKCYAVVDVEMDSCFDMIKCHNLADRIERDFKEELNIHLSVHIDPVEPEDHKSVEIRKKVERAVASFSNKLTIHDLRITGEDGVKICFDVLAPFGSAVSAEEIEKEVRKELGEGDYNIIIEIDGF